MSEERADRSSSETQADAGSSHASEEPISDEPARTATPPDPAIDSSERGGDDKQVPYEWIGMLAAGLGFFLTPVLTGPVAGYCAYRILDENATLATLIVGLVVTTAVFWVVVGLFLIGPNL